MDFFQVVDARRSVRAFADDVIDVQTLERILAAVQRAPSAGNLQAYRIVVVAHAAARRALAAAALYQGFVAEAPVVLVFCADPARSAVRYQQRGRQLYSLQDATIACSYAMLAATALGLGSVWVGAFDEAAVRAALQLPAGWNPVAILPIGFPAENPEASDRRSLQDLVLRR